MYKDRLISNIVPRRSWGRRYVSDYSKLLDYLYSREFTWLIEQDKNRAADGIWLRRELSEDSEAACTVLEMMIALTKRASCEIIGITEDDDDVQAELFWTMIDNLGLIKYDNKLFDIEQVEKIVNRFLARGYRADGRGSLFIVHNGRDMRQTEIWYQMNFYLVENDI